MYKTKLSERVEILPGRTPVEFTPNAWGESFSLVR